MSEPIGRKVGCIKLILKLNVVSILGVLLLLISEEIGVEIGLVVRLVVVFARLYVAVGWDWERRNLGGIVVVNVDGVDVLLDRLAGEIISLRFLWSLRG